MGLHDALPGLEYLRELRRSNPKGYQIHAGQITLLCNTPGIRAKTTFKLLDSTRQLDEFRTRSGLRLYGFLEGETLVILTNGGKKNTSREQNRNIQRAKKQQDDFHRLMNQGATLRITVQDEDQIR